jgi:membrane protease YdiL (CAAX protease family)
MLSWAIIRPPYSSSMKRLGQFLRSIIPADPWQLVFLAGVVLLFISPRLLWGPDAEILGARHNPLHPNPAAATKNAGVLLPSLYCLTFASLLLYFTCFYPGRKPVRQILWFGLLPGLFSLLFTLFLFYRISAPATSVLQSHSSHPPLLVWRSSDIWHFLPAGLYFSAFSFLLIFIFLVRLQLGKSSLPLVLPGTPVSADDATESWDKIQVLVFVLLCPLFLFLALASFPLTAFYLFSSQPLTPFSQSSIRIIAALLDAAVLVGLALWALGPSDRRSLPSVFRCPELHDAFFAFVLPISLSALLSASGYLIARTNWAIYAFPQTSAPQFADYFDLARVKNPWLLMMTAGAFAEEFVFRGVLLGKLMSRYGFDRGIFLTGTIWAAYHFRSDSYYGLSASGIILHLVNRILICLTMNYVLSWMTLRWKSIIPAGITHTTSNILVVAGVSNAIPWNGELRILEWALVAVLLARYWPLARTAPSEEIPPPVPLESAA